MKISGGKLRKLLKCSIVFVIVVSNLTTPQKILTVSIDVVNLEGVLWDRTTDKFLKQNRQWMDNVDNFMEKLLSEDFDYRKHPRTFEHIDLAMVEMCNNFEQIADQSRGIFLRGYFCIEDDDEDFKDLLDNAPKDLKTKHEMDVRYFKTTYAIMQFLKGFRFNFDLLLRYFEQKSQSLLQDNEKFNKADINRAINACQCNTLYILLALDIIAIIVILLHTKKMLYFYFISVFMMQVISNSLKWYVLKVVIALDVIQYNMDEAKIISSFEKPQLSLHMVLMFGLLITLNDIEKSFKYLSKYMWSSGSSDTKNQRIPEPIANVSTKKQKKKTVDILENFYCPVCFELMKAPLQIYGCFNDHFICSTCLNKPILKCPMCRVDFKNQKPTRRRTSEQVLSNLLDSRSK